MRLEDLEKLAFQLKDAHRLSPAQEGKGFSSSGRCSRPNLVRPLDLLLNVLQKVKCEVNRSILRSPCHSKACMSPWVTGMCRSARTAW